MSQSKIIHAHLPPELLKSLSALVEEGHYATQAEAIRHGLRILLQTYKE